MGEEKVFQALKLSKHLFEDHFSQAQNWFLNDPKIFPQWSSSFFTPQITNFHAILSRCEGVGMQWWSIKKDEV